MPATPDSELEAFKTAIDLRAYAVGLGYALDRRESWRGSSVMRNEGTGDTLIVKRDRDQHYVYFLVRDDRDNGSIIDFAMRKRASVSARCEKNCGPGLAGRRRPYPPSLPSRSRRKTGSRSTPLFAAWQKRRSILA